MSNNSDDDDGYYRFGIFYFKPSNRRVFVLGANNRPTLNFANKWAYVILVIILITFTLGMLVKWGVIG